MQGTPTFMKKVVMKKTFSFFMSLLMSAVSLQAADIYVHNLDITAGGGLQSIQFNPDQGGDHKPGIGANFNLLYRYNFSKHWGIGTGIGLGFYNAHSKYDSLRIEKMIVHPENGHTYSHSATFDEWDEVQRMLDLEIPFGFYYTTEVNEKWNFLTGFGVKFNLPFWNKFKIVDGTLETKGFFEDYTNIEYEKLPQHNFYVQDYFAGRATLRPAGASAYLDLAFTRVLKDNVSLYLGAYVAYRFTNMIKESTTPLYEPESNNYIGVISSDMEDKARTLSAGVKIGITIGFPKIDSSAIIAERIAAEEARLAEEKRINDSIAAAQAEQERLAREEQERIAREEAERLAKEKEAELQKAQETVQWLSKNIRANFALGKADIIFTPEVEENLEFIRKFLNSNPDRVLVVTGHTCDLGAYEKNVKLSKQRAEAMKAALVMKGINPANIETVGMGPNQPLVPNTSEANRKLNRRIEISIDKYQAKDVE